MAGEFVKVAATSEVPENAVKVFTVQDRRVAICHAEDGFYAVADLCSHDGGPLGEGDLFDHQIECPRHGAKFDITTGKVLCLPAVTPIPAYPLEVRGNDIWICTSSTVGSEAKS